MTFSAWLCDHLEHPDETFGTIERYLMDWASLLGARPHHVEISVNMQVSEVIVNALNQCRREIYKTEADGM